MDAIAVPAVSAVAIALAVHLGTTAVVRWADDRAVRQPRTPRCVTNDHDLGWREVVPVWSFVAGRGRCRTCSQRIPAELPVVEVALVAVLVAVAWRHPGLELLLLLPVAWSAVVATPIDLARQIIPNRLTYPLGLWSLVAVTLLVVVGGEWADWRRAIMVGIALPAGMEFLSLAFLVLRGQRGMGLGDVKWAVSLGIATGWLGSWAVVAMLAATVLTSGIVSLALVVSGRAADARIPYGPYLAAGVVVALLVTPQMVWRVLT